MKKNIRPSSGYAIINYPLSSINYKLSYRWKAPTCKIYSTTFYQCLYSRPISYKALVGTQESVIGNLHRPFVTILQQVFNASSYCDNMALAIKYLMLIGKTAWAKPSHCLLLSLALALKQILPIWNFLCQRKLQHTEFQRISINCICFIQGEFYSVKCTNFLLQASCSKLRTVPQNS